MALVSNRTSIDFPTAPAGTTCKADVIIHEANVVALVKKGRWHIEDCREFWCEITTTAKTSHLTIYANSSFPEIVVTNDTDVNFAEIEASQTLELEKVTLSGREIAVFEWGHWMTPPSKKFQFTIRTNNHSAHLTISLVNKQSCV